MCNHIKYGVVYESYKTTRTICEGTDYQGQGSAKIEVCDHCHNFIITIKTWDGNIKVLELNSQGEPE